MIIMYQKSVHYVEKNMKKNEIIISYLNFKLIMNQTQIKDYMKMINYINMYIHNTDIEEIAYNVFSSEVTNDVIDIVEKLQNNFMNKWSSLNINQKENMIKYSYQKYKK